MILQFVVYRLGLIVYRIWFHPLRKFPGPTLWISSDLPFNYTNNVSGTAIEKIKQMHKKYGPVVRVGPDRLTLDGSIGWPQVYARRSGGQREYEKAPRIFAPGSEESIIASQHDVHRRQRRQLGHAFSDAAMYEQEATINHYIQLLVRRVEEHAVEGKTMNIVQWLNFTTFDIIGDLTFGDSFRSLESSNYHPWVLNIFEGLKGDALIRACRNYPKISPLLLHIFGGSQAKKGELTRELSRTKGKARMEKGLQPQGRRDFMTYVSHDRTVIDIDIPFRPVQQ